MKNRTKTLFSLLLIIIIPILIVIFLFFGIKAIKSLSVRYPESKIKYQEELLLGLCDENNILQIDNRIIGDIFFAEYDKDNDYQMFRILETPFSDRYEINYRNGLVTETYGYNESSKSYESNYATVEQFINNLYSFELNLSDIDIDINYEQPIFKEQKEIIVKCKLNGDNPLSIKLNKENKEIVFEDVEIIYNYSLVEDNDNITFMVIASYQNIKYTIFVQNK